MQVWDQVPRKLATGQGAAFDILRETRMSDEKSMAAQIHDLLHGLIVSLELRPYQRLSEKEISDALRASKTPVREALIRLEDSGLVNIVPKSGSYVTGISIDRYVDGCFVRLNLEIGAARRAAGKDCDEDDLAALDAIVDEQVSVLDQQDYVAFFNLDETLHHAIFEIAGVSGAWKTVKRSQADVDRVRHLKRLFGIRRATDVIEEHRAILRAIRAGAPDAAEQAIVAHLGSLKSEIQALGQRPMLLDYIDSLNSPKSTRRARRA